MSIVFYDTETTGLDPAFDQIIQFAAIRTDEDLSEIDRYEVRCRLQPHIVPAPKAVLTNRIRAASLIDPTLPSHYEMAHALHAKLKAWSPSVFIGYNSLRFDEAFLRQALYQTLHIPYLTNMNGNSRTDALRMVQAASIYAPEAITVPRDNDGRPVFRLEVLSRANGIDHHDPHDAMSDVKATLDLSRFIYERARGIWSDFMRFSQKAAVVAYVEEESVFCISECFAGRPYAWIVTPLGRNAQNSSEYYVVDLSVDPAELAALADEPLAARLKEQPRPMRSLRANGAPLLLPLEDAPPFAAGRDLPADEIQRRVAFLLGDDALRERLKAAFEANRVTTPHIHVEQQIHDAFLSPEDQRVLGAFHQAPWKERVGIAVQFQDKRMRQLARRLLFVERPRLLSDRLRARLERMQAKRLLATGSDIPWRTLGHAVAELDHVLAEAGPKSEQFLYEHNQFLSQCRVRAEAICAEANAEPANQT